MSHSPGRGESSVEMWCVRGIIAVRENVETRVCVARRETDVSFDEPA